MNDDHDKNIINYDGEENNLFEFSFDVSSTSSTSDLSDIYPVFNRNLFISDPNPAELRSESTSSASSAPISGEFCSWSPDRACKKSSSTGSGPGPGSTSKRGKVKDIGKKRSSSDGKEKLSHLKSSDSGTSKVNLTGTGTGTGEGKKKVIKEMDLVTAHKLFYGKEKGGEKGEGKRSFFPRPELVGLFVNSRAHHHHPFNS